MPQIKTVFMNIFKCLSSVFGAARGLVVVVVSSLIGLFLVVLALRQYGMSLSYKPFNHPLMKETRLVFEPFSSVLTEPRKQQQGGIVSVCMTQDKALVVCPESLGGRRKIEASAHSEVSEYPRLATTIETELDSTPLLLMILSNVPEIDKVIEKFIIDHELSDQVILSSPHDIVIQALRKRQPRWIFAAGQSEKMRLKLLSMVGLEPIAPIDSDIIIWNRADVSQRIIDEIHRRRKKVFLAGIPAEQQEVGEFSDWDGFVRMEN